DIEERKAAGYLQAKYDFDLFGIRADGLVGVRMEKIKRELNAFSFDASTGVYSAITRNTEDTNTLPNASLNLHFNEAWQLRLVAAKTLSYPDFGALNPSISL